MATSYFPTFLLLLFMCSMSLFLLTLLPSNAPSLPFSSPPSSSPWPSPSCGQAQAWAVRLHAGPPHDEEDADQNSGHLDVIATRVAEQAGLQNQGQIGQLEGHYLLCSAEPGPEARADIWSKSVKPGDVLAAHPHVVWYSKERVLSRWKRSVAFNDPNYTHQWHLHNNRNKGLDINVTGVWERNITGQGVTVVVVDDGVEHTHQDIQPNYSPEGSYDLNSNDPDPMPHPDVHSDNHHGTRCAGEIAAVPNNSFCAVGVAYGSKVAGIRVLDGPLTDSLEAIAFNKHYQVNDIYSCSWGPDDDGHTVDGPHPLGKAALQHGVIAGRRGFGSIFVVASGNGGSYNDNCNYDGYANSIYTITVGAVDEFGGKPFYAEDCASMLAVTFSSGGGKLRSIVTSDWSLQQGTGCTDSHTGTSAAAPLAAGMVALMLQVRPCLSWRDVQHIIAFTATKCDNRLAEWQVNGAGFNHSPQHGFGLLNAWRLVNAAKVWESVPFLVSYQSLVKKEEASISTYPDQLIRTWNVSSADLKQSGMETLEHVAVTVTIDHPCRGNVEVVLVCPSGMSSVIGARRAIDRDPAGYQDWTFSTVRCWGEKAEGLYVLRISDHSKAPSLTHTVGGNTVHTLSDPPLCSCRRALVQAVRRRRRVEAVGADSVWFFYDLQRGQGQTDAGGGSYERQVSGQQLLSALPPRPGYPSRDSQPVHFQQPEVPVAVGLLCSFLVSLLHTGGHIGPPALPRPFLEKQAAGRCSAEQAGPRRERTGGGNRRGGGGGRRGGRWGLRCGVASGAGLRVHVTFKRRAACDIAQSQITVLSLHLSPAYLHCLRPRSTLPDMVEEGSQSDLQTD